MWCTWVLTTFPSGNVSPKKKNYTYQITQSKQQNMWCEMSADRRTSIYFGLMIHWPYSKWTSPTVTIFVWQIIRKSIMCPLSCHLKISPGVPGSPGNPSSPLSPLGPAECPLVIDSYAQIHRHWDNICVGKLALIHIYSRVTQQKKQVNIRKLICKVKSHNQRLW